MKILFLLLFWSLWFVNFSTRTVISPILPILEDELSIGHAQAGSIFSFLSLGYTATLLLSGLLSPRIGYKRTIILGYAILSIALFCFKYTHNYTSTVVVCLFIGLGAGLYLPSAIPLITAIFGRDNWGKVISFHETAASSSIFALPLLSALALRFIIWRDLFFILSAASAIVIFTFWLCCPDTRAEEKRGGSLAQIVRRREFWIIAILWIFAASNSLGLYNVIPLFLVKEKGMNLEFANTIFGFSRIGGIFVAIITGFLVDRYGVKNILLLLLLTTGFSTIGLAMSRALTALVIMLFVQATVSNVFFPVSFVAVSKLTTTNERSTFTGTTMAIGVIIGLGLTPALLGAVADTWNFQIGILVLGVLTLVSCVTLKYLQKI